MIDSRRRKIAQIILWVSVVVMIVHFAALDYSNFVWQDALSPLSNALMIIAMYTVIKDIDKKSQT